MARLVISTFVISLAVFSVLSEAKSRDPYKVCSGFTDDPPPLNLSSFSASFLVPFSSVTKEEFIIESDRLGFKSLLLRMSWGGEEFLYSFVGVL